MFEPQRAWLKHINFTKMLWLQLQWLQSEIRLGAKTPRSDLNSAQKDNKTVRERFVMFAVDV